MVEDFKWVTISIPWSFRFDYPDGEAGKGSIWFMDPVEMQPVLYARFEKIEVFGDGNQPIYCFGSKHFRSNAALENYVCDEVPMVIAKAMWAKTR